MSHFHKAILISLIVTTPTLIAYPNREMPLCIAQEAFQVPDVYTNEFKSCFLAASAWQQIFGLHLRLAIQQWSLAPDAKIGAASLPKFQLLSSFVYK